MRVLSSIFVDSSEEIRVRHRDDLNSSYIETGSRYDSDSLPVAIKGLADERADFLRRLAAAATAAADDLDAAVAVVAAREQEKRDRQVADLEALRLKLTGGVS